MTKQVSNIQTQNENNLSLNDNNRFLDCEEIVDELVEKGLPSSFSPENFITKISNNYNITYQEARTCLKLAIKQLESQEKNETDSKNNEEKLYAQSGYYYPQGYTNSITKQKDGMDSLSSLASYNRLMFGLR